MTARASRGLTHRQNRFVGEFMIDGNATQAAIRAGYSSQTARQMGAENLSKPVIKKQIDEAVQQRSTRNQAINDDLVYQAHRLLRADISEIFDRRGVPVPIAEMPIEFRQGLIQSIKVRLVISDGQHKVSIISLRFADRLTLLRAIGDRLGAWAKRGRGDTTPPEPRAWVCPAGSRPCLKEAGSEDASG